MVYRTSIERLANRYGGEFRRSGKLAATDGLRVHVELCEVTMTIRTACNTNSVGCIGAQLELDGSGFETLWDKRLPLPLTHAEGPDTHLVSSTKGTVRISRG